MEENNTSSVSKADTYEKIGEFWDSHDFTEYESVDCIKDGQPVI